MTTETITVKKYAHRDLPANLTLAGCRDLMDQLAAEYGAEARVYWTSCEVSIQYERPETDDERRTRLYQAKVDEHTHAVALGGWEKLTELERKALGLRYPPGVGEVPF